MSGSSWWVRADRVIQCSEGDQTIGVNRQLRYTGMGKLKFRDLLHRFQIHRSEIKKKQYLLRKENFVTEEDS